MHRTSKIALLAVAILTIAAWVLIGVRHQKGKPQAAWAELKQVAPSALYEKRSQEVTGLSAESVEQSLSRLAWVTPYYSPGPSPDGDLRAPDGLRPLAPDIGQEDLGAIMSNRRVRKVLDDIARMDKVSASKLVSNELAAALDDYLPRYERLLEAINKVFSLENTATNRPRGISWAISAPDGEVVIHGAKLRVFSLISIAANLELTGVRPEIERAATIALNQRTQLYTNPIALPHVKVDLLISGTLYNRQVLGTGLLTVATNDPTKVVTLKAEDLNWKEVTLASYQAALTEYDQMVRWRVLNPDYSSGSRSFKFLSAMSDDQFDTLMKDLRLTR